MSRTVGLAVLSYALVAAVYTWPLVLTPLSAFPGQPGDADVHGFLWNNWWIAEALWARHQSPLRTDMIFAPFGADLRLHTFGLLYGVLSSPVMPVLGAVGVLSMQLLLTPVLNGLAAYGLVTKLSGRRASGLVAGMLLAATPAVNFHLTVGRASCAAVWPVLWAISALLDVLERPSKQSAAWFGVALLVLLLVDQQMALFGLLWLMVLGADALVRGRISRPALRSLAMAAAVVVIPFLWLYAAPLTATGYTVPAASEAATYSYPPSLFWRPAMIWRAYGAMLPLAFLAATWQLRRDRALVVWWLGAALFLVLSLGPAAEVFALLQHLPGFTQFRTPYRFQIPAAVGLVVMAGLMVSRAPRRTIAAVLLAAAVDLIAFRAVHGMSLQTMPAEPVYAQIAADPADRLVLEVPVGVRTGTDRIGPGEVFTFYQPLHRKRLINGLLARGPLDALDYYRRSPALMLLAHEPPPPGDVDADLRRQLKALNVGYIVIHTDQMDSVWQERVLDLFSDVGAERLETGRSETLAFRLP
jgi:hypothetical protein